MIASSWNIWNRCARLPWAEHSSGLFEVAVWQEEEMKAEGTFLETNSSNLKTASGVTLQSLVTKRCAHSGRTFLHSLLSSGQQRLTQLPHSAFSRERYWKWDHEDIERMTSTLSSAAENPRYLLHPTQSVGDSGGLQWLIHSYWFTVVAMLSLFWLFKVITHKLRTRPENTTVLSMINQTILTTYWKYWYIVCVILLD